MINATITNQLGNHVWEVVSDVPPRIVKTSFALENGHEMEVFILNTFDARYVVTCYVHSLFTVEEFYFHNVEELVEFFSQLAPIFAPIAQRIRVLGFEPSGRGFESLWECHTPD